MPRVLFSYTSASSPVFLHSLKSVGSLILCAPSYSLFMRKIILRPCAFAFHMACDFSDRSPFCPHVLRSTFGRQQVDVGHRLLTRLTRSRSSSKFAITWNIPFSYYRYILSPSKLSTNSWRLGGWWLSVFFCWLGWDISRSIFNQAYIFVCLIWTCKWSRIYCSGPFHNPELCTGKSSSDGCRVI